MARKQATRFLAAMTLGAVAGVAVGGGLRLFVRQDASQTAMPEIRAEGVLAREQEPAGLAVAYARAYQEGNWTWVMDHTLWIRERLDRVRREGGGAEAVSHERMELSRALGDRSVENNQLRPWEGLDDQYVFAPGAKIEVTGVDEGRQDLAEPALRRTWFRVSFPERQSAPRGENSLPVRRLVAGVNETPDGYILKAGLIGNTEIDFETVSYLWEDDARRK